MRELVADVAGARREVNREDQISPSFAALVEIDGIFTPSIEVVDRLVRDVRIPLDNAGTPSLAGWNSGSPVKAEVGLMGTRSFLRVSVNPVQPGDGSIRAEMLERIEAVITLENEPPAESRDASVAGLMTISNGLACPPLMPGSVPEGSGEAVSFVSRRSVGGGVAWKIYITGPGLFRLTGADLTNAGLPSAYLDTSQLRLTSRDRAVPYWSTTSGVLQATDSLIFYGAGIDSSYTTQNVYWLEAGVSPVSADYIQAATNALWPITTSTWATVSAGPTNIFNPEYLPEDDSFDHWFHEILLLGSTNNILLSTPHAVATGPVQVRQVAYGILSITNLYPSYTNTDRRTEVRIGANVVGFSEYAGEVRSDSCWTSVPAGWLSGTSTLFKVVQALPSGYATNKNNQLQKSYLQRLEVTYQRALIFSNQPSFYFRGPETSSNVRITGYGTTNLWLLDITDPFSPNRMTGYRMQTNGGLWSIYFGQTSLLGRCYGLIATSAIRRVDSISRVVFRGLSDTNRTPDYLVVVPSEFREPAYRLLKHRFKNGMSVQAVSPDDVYNEFSYGIKDPAALRQYFGYAFHHYSHPPGYALLIGNGSYDPLNRLGYGETDLIPVKLGPSAALWNAHEQWFVTIAKNGSTNDRLADIRLGRVPAKTNEDVSRFVDKVISYDATDPNDDAMRRAYLIADDEGPKDPPFKDHVEWYIRSYLKPEDVFGDIYAKGAYLDDGPISYTNINAEIEAGTQIISYVGHGDPDQWTSVPIWETNHAVSVNNSFYPIFTIFTCRNGEFQSPRKGTLAEAIILSEHCGSACLAPTGLSEHNKAMYLADGFYRTLATGQVDRLGMVVDGGFLELYLGNPGANELLFYSLFGDPAQQVWGGGVP